MAPHIQILFFIILFVTIKTVLMKAENNGDMNLATDAEESRLTHVVMPFHPRQADRVLFNLKSWLKYTPCDCPLKQIPSDLTENSLDKNIKFIFFVSSKFNQTLQLELLSKFDSIKPCCFTGGSKVYFGDLGKDDTYLKGSRLMFEQMLARKIFEIGDTVSHVFYMEPDCLPVRSLWLAALENRIIVPNAKFWLKGSNFRGNPATIKSQYIYNQIHINGNAIYNIGDKDLAEFYFYGLRRFIKKFFKEGAYDTDFFKFLLWENGIYAKDIFHLFKFDDFIQNHWHSSFSLSNVLRENPDTFFVHGGTNVDEDGK